MGNIVRIAPPSGPCGWPWQFGKSALENHVLHEICPLVENRRLLFQNVLKIVKSMEETPIEATNGVISWRKMNADLDCTAGSQYAARLLRNAAAAGSVEGPPRCARCPLRASEDAFHARSWFSRLPVRQKTLFTHGVGSRAFSCVRICPPAPSRAYDKLAYCMIGPLFVRVFPDSRI